jgi:hypothetical protein
VASVLQAAARLQAVKHERGRVMRGPVGIDQGDEFVGNGF